MWYNLYVIKGSNPKRKEVITMNQRIDRRIHYKIVLDTETCPIDRACKEVSPDNMWVYDCGWVITDKRGKIYRTRSFVNADIFLNEKIAMTSAYYADKVPQYWEDIKAGRRILTSFRKIRETYLADVEEFRVTETYAHNARFDYGTLNTTQRWLTKSKYRYFFPYEMTICDTLKMARDVLGNMPTYLKFCNENEYTTKSGKPRYTAEIIYRYITKDNDFTEEHKGLDDCLIEKEIMAYCYRQHKKMRRVLFDKK